MSEVKSKLRNGIKRLSELPHKIRSESAEKELSREDKLDKVIQEYEFWTKMNNWSGIPVHSLETRTGLKPEEIPTDEAGREYVSEKCPDPGILPEMDKIEAEKSGCGYCFDPEEVYLQYFS